MVSGAAAEWKEEGAEVVVVQVEHGSVLGVGRVEPASSGEEPAPGDTGFVRRLESKMSIWRLYAVVFDENACTFEKLFF